MVSKETVTAMVMGMKTENGWARRITEFEEFRKMNQDSKDEVVWQLLKRLNLVVWLNQTPDYSEIELHPT